jgi:hypothetical protein
VDTDASTVSVKAESAEDSATENEPGKSSARFNFLSKK